MREVWDEVAFSRLLLSERIWVNVPLLAEVVVESGLARKFAPIYFFGPERVLAQMLPRDSLDRIFFK